VAPAATLCLVLASACAPPSPRPTPLVAEECQDLNRSTYGCQLNSTVMPDLPPATYAQAGAWTGGHRTDITIDLELQMLGTGGWVRKWNDVKITQGVASASFDTFNGPGLYCGPGTYRWYARVSFASDPGRRYYAVGTSFFMA
jgi:hypothetical protein